MLPQGAEQHQVVLHLPQRTYVPCAPFQTRRAVSAYGRITAIETQRIEPGKNQHQLVPPVFDYAEEHVAQLDAAEERRREARLVRKEIEQRRKQQQHLSVLQSSTQYDGAVRRIPMRHGHSHSVTSEFPSHHYDELGSPQLLLSNKGNDAPSRRRLRHVTTHVPSSWELMRSLDAFAEEDASYWVPRKYTAGVSGFDEAVDVPLCERAYAQPPQSVSEESDEGASGLARELLVSLLNTTKETTGSSAEAALSAASKKAEAAVREVPVGSVAEEKKLGKEHLPLAQAVSIPQLLIAVSNRDAIVSSPAAPDWQNYFTRYRVTEEDLDGIDHVIHNPIRVLLCDGDDGRSMKERYVTFEVLQNASVDSIISQPQKVAVFLSLRAGKLQESPVLARYGLHHLVDVTIGAGFSVNFLPHLRSAKHVKESGAAHLQLSDSVEDAMRREVAQFSKVEKPQSMPSVKSSIESRKAFQSRMDEYCKKLEDAFPFFVGPAKSFSERSTFSSRSCFSCWLLFPDGQKADSLDFVAVGEDESLLLVDALRMLVRLNQPLQSTTATTSSTTVGLSEKGKVERNGQPASTLSLAERRWLCHALCYARPAPLSRGASKPHTLQPDLAALLSRTPPTSSGWQKGLAHRPPDII